MMINQTTSITREEALTLVKALHAETSYLVDEASATPHQLEIRAIVERLEQFLVHGTDEEETIDEEEQDDADKDEELAEEEDDCEDEVEDEAYEAPAEAACSPEEGEGEGDLEAGYVISAGELSDLKPLRGTYNGVEGALRFFEMNQMSGLDFTTPIGSIIDLHDIDYVKRRGTTELHVRTSATEWHVFFTKRFPKAWSDALPVNELVLVSEDDEEEGG